MSLLRSEPWAAAPDVSRRTADRKGGRARRIPLATILAWAALALTGNEAGAYHVYYANLHSHCALSDGIGTPQEAFAHARDVANIDVLALTDHTHLLTTTEFNTLLSVAAAYTQPGVFVALGSQEFGSLTEFGHINIYDAPTRNPLASSDLLGTYNFIRTNGAIGCFNHPSPDYGTNFDNLNFYSEYEDAMRALEVRNGMATDHHEDSYVQALSNGWKIGPFAGQDNHEGLWGDQPNPNGGGAIYLTGILADSLTRDEILTALRQRRFFAMEVDPPTDRMELDFRVDGHPMGSEVVTDVNPTFSATAHSANGFSLFNRLELYKDGMVVETYVQIGTTISHDFHDFIPDGETHYYFVRGRQVDGDLCWSAPVWVTSQQTPGAVAEEGTPVRLFSAPNPMTSSTEIRFVLPGLAEASRTRFAAGTFRRVRLTVHDGTGRLVRDLGEQRLSPGPHAWVWDGRDRTGQPLPAGIYFSRIQGDGLAPQSGRLVLLR